MTHHPLIEKMITAVTEGDLFSREEAIALLRTVSADEKGSLADNIERVVMWARHVRTEQAILDVILKLGAVDAIDVRPSPDGDGVVMRLDPTCTIEMRP